MVSDIKGFDSRQTPGARTGETGVVRADPRAGAGRQTGSAARDDTVELSGVADLIATAVRKLAAEPPSTRRGRRKSGKPSPAGATR